MSNIKSEAADLINSLPDNSNWEDIQYHIYVREKIERGRKDIKSGNIISQKEAERTVNKWLKSSGHKPH